MKERWVKDGKNVYRRSDEGLMVALRRHKAAVWFKRLKNGWQVQLAILGNPIEFEIIMPDDQDMTPIMLWHLARDFLYTQLDLPTDSTFTVVEAKDETRH
jgi:hypothetical protein